MPFAVVNGARLNYVQMSAEEGEAREHLVMVHGLATNMAFWYFQYAPIFAKRFRITLVDLRGHGRSEMTPGGYTPQGLARDLGGLLDHLQIDRAHFVAHSFGGVVALNLACAEPGRFQSLVLADTHISAARRAREPRGWQSSDKIQGILDKHQIRLDTHDPYFGYKLLTEVAHLQMSSSVVPPALLELVSPLLGKHGNRTASQWLKLVDTTDAEAEMMGDDGLGLERLSALRFPILAMYGDHSQARLTGKELLEVWPHAEFRRVRDAGHFFPTSRPDEVISGCERFWEGDFTQHPKHRQGERRKSHFRSDRIFSTSGAWYYITREQARMGPFADRGEAQEHLGSYLSAVVGAQAEAVEVAVQ